MRQQTLASQASLEQFGRKGKREQFLDQMNQVVPWSELLALVEPYYPKAGNGRQPVGLAIMLRTYFWYKHTYHTTKILIIFGCGERSTMVKSFDMWCIS